MTPHLRGHVRAYVDRALPAPMLHAFDRHLVCCTSCRALADQERRIVASLRADTGVPQGLRSALMGLASATGPSTHSSFDSSPDSAAAPDVPRPPVGFRMPPGGFPQPVPTVSPRSPALHRSPVRAAVVASLAAGASVAAAWGLAVSPLPTNSPLRTPVARVPAGPATVAPVSLSPAFVAPPRSRAAGVWSTPAPRVAQAGVVGPFDQTSPSRNAPVTTPVRLSLVTSAESRP